jgi:hypothetical protein
VAVGDSSTLYWNGGIENKNKPNMKFLTRHGEQTDPGVVEEVMGELPPYGRALLQIGDGSGIDPSKATVVISPPAVNIVKVSVTTVGVLECTVTMLVECELTDEAHAGWQLAVYDTLFSAWAQWRKEYQAGLLRQTMLGSSASDAGSSQASSPAQKWPR